MMRRIFYLITRINVGSRSVPYNFANSKNNGWYTCFKVVLFDPLPIPNIIMIKTACIKSEIYKSYDYFKMTHKHDAEHDVAKKTSRF